jgi:hypothetical protein
VADTVGSTGRDSRDYARRDVDEKRPMIPSRIIGQENTPSQALQRFEDTFSLPADALGDWLNRPHGGGR